MAEESFDLLAWINDETPAGGFLELFPVATQNMEDGLRSVLENIEGQMVTDASLGNTQACNPVPQNLVSKHMFLIYHHLLFLLTIVWYDNIH